jgi:hypothetical protein
MYTNSSLATWLTTSAGMSASRKRMPLGLSRSRRVHGACQNRAKMCVNSNHFARTRIVLRLDFMCDPRVLARNNGSFAPRTFVAELRAKPIAKHGNDLRRGAQKRLVQNSKNSERHSGFARLLQNDARKTALPRAQQRPAYRLRSEPLVFCPS